MPKLPPASHLLAFEAVARRRSFAGAAAELHLTSSAVSHQIARLEADLGVRLFERSARQIRLSAAGTRYLERVAGALEAIAAATEDLRQGTDSALRVHAAPSLASLWLLPRLPDFARAHPDIALSLSAAHTHSDFALGQADLDIRYGVPEWPGLVVEPLLDEAILPLASPRFAEARAVTRPDDLAGLPLIQSTVSVVQWADWFLAFAGVPAPDTFPLRFDRALMSLDAASQGLGVTLESATIAARHLADGRLVALLDGAHAIPVQAHFAVYPARHAQRPAVAAFLAWLHDQATLARTGPAR